MQISVDCGTVKSGRVFRETKENEVCGKKDNNYWVSLVSACVLTKLSNLKWWRVYVYIRIIVCTYEGAICENFWLRYKKKQAKTPKKLKLCTECEETVFTICERHPCLMLQRHLLKLGCHLSPALTSKPLFVCSINIYLCIRSRKYQ